MNLVEPGIVGGDLCPKGLLSEVERALRHRFDLGAVAVRLPDASGEQVEAWTRAVFGELRSYDRRGAFEDGTLLLVLPHVPRRHAVLVAERLLHRLSADHEAAGVRVSVSMLSQAEPPSAERLVEDTLEGLERAGSAVEANPTGLMNWRVAAG